jgi:molybdopterin synthase catalytic subunit
MQDDFIKIQTADFDFAEQYRLLCQSSAGKIGAVIVFAGLVRDISNGSLKAMELEHYPGMTQTYLKTIVQKARARWPLLAVQVIHRIGRLQPCDQIVYVGVASCHRSDAFKACEYIMDYLKQDAPFWKAEITDDGKHWVAVKSADQQADRRWQST